MSDFERPARVVKRRPVDGISVGTRSEQRHAFVDHDRAAQSGEPAPAAAAPQAVLQEPASKKPPLDMSLPGGESAVRRRFKRIDSIWKDIRKWSFRGTAAVLILVIVVGGFLFSKGYLKLHKVFQGGQSAAALQTNVDPNLLKGEGDGRINVLLLGKGGPGHDGPDLTDTMLILSVDPVNKTAALLSVPRDLWVNVPGYGDMKINAAYANAKYRVLAADPSATKRADQTGVTVAEQTVEHVVGIPIHYYAMLDFTAFQKAVDTVGGVKINVPESLYDPTMAWQNDWNPVLAQKGVQNFDGYHALLYVRSRETSSDFARTERQRQLIVALEQKVFSLGTFTNPLKISSLMDEFGNHAETDMSITDALRFYKIMHGINTTKIQSIGLTDAPHDFITTDAVGDQSVDRPIAGFSNYSAIQNYVRNTLRDGYIAKENARITVVNGTKTASAATKEAAILKSYGYNVTSVKDKPLSREFSHTEVINLTHGGKKYTAHYLETRFKTSAKAKLPQGVQASSTDFAIIVGG